MRDGIDTLFQTALSLDAQAAKAYDAGQMSGAFGFRMLRMKANNVWDTIAHRASIGAYLAG